MPDGDDEVRFLELLAARLRRGVEIRNHQTFKVLRVSCAAGSALVSWLVGCGSAESRADGAELCLRLVRLKLMIPAAGRFDDGRSYDSFRDADGSFYRFRQDDPAAGGLLESVTLEKPGAHAWEFAPHTAHNSLALDVALAEDLARAAAEVRAAATDRDRDERRRAAREALLELRRRVRDALDGDAPGWVAFKGGRGGARREPLAEFLDFETRRKWESTFGAAVVVEGLADAFSGGARGAERRAAPATADADWAALDLTGRPAGMSIASASSATRTSTARGAALRARRGSACPRVVFRTARLPRSSLFRPRSVCAFQDAFGGRDVGDGAHPEARYVYEISVRHARVREEPGHVTAEVLLLAHRAAPAADDPTSSDLTVVSAVDCGRGSSVPVWVRQLVTGEDAKFGALAAFESPARAAARDLDASADLRDDEESSRDGVKVSLADFELVAVLGRGGFGTVLQVRGRTDGRVYAMKVFKKAELRKRRQIERTRTERHIIQQADHPYIVKLRYAFQTPAKLYMVMDFAQGGDFFSFLRRFRRLDEAWARFYLAELALALQHLHDIAVVYRDLKPESVLMDGGGHAMLADFGLSRNFARRSPLPQDAPRRAASQRPAAPPGTPPGARWRRRARARRRRRRRTGPRRHRPPERGGRGEAAPAAQLGEWKNPLVATRSYCGTEQYMAPEMLLQRAHTRAVDWWGLGLLAHEMVASRHPFQGASHGETLRNMVRAGAGNGRAIPDFKAVRAEPDLDPRLTDDCAALIRGLLCKHAPRRLGTKRGAVELARDPFFKHRVDWARVARREAEPPYRPNCASDADVGHFDAEFTDEAPRDSDYKPRPGAGDGRGRNRDYFFDLFTLNFSKRGAAAPRDASHCGEFAGFSYNPSHLDT
ncbi:serine/threonine kinase [Aureococcus anophagefferens]|nr:serine/threonine kinase [Aureococcus anophagefferens]